MHELVKEGHFKNPTKMVTFKRWTLHFYIETLQFLSDLTSGISLLVILVSFRVVDGLRTHRVSSRTATYVLEQNSPVHTLRKVAI